MKRVVTFLPLLLLPGGAIAGVAEDFEVGSGGIKLAELDLAISVFIYALMCLFVGWVLYNSLKDMIDAGSGEYYPIYARIFRSCLLCIVVILTLT